MQERPCGATEKALCKGGVSREKPSLQASKLPSFHLRVLPAVAGPKSAKICVICGSITDYRDARDGHGREARSAER